MKNLKLVLLFFITILLITNKFCYSAGNKNIEWVKYDIKESFLNNKLESSDYYFGENTGFKNIKIYIDSICFNRDTTKMVGFVRMNYDYDGKYSTLQAGNYSDFVSVIGYFNGNSWMIFDFNRLSMNFYTNETEMKRFAYDFYFNNIEKEFANIFNYKTQKMEKAYYCNINTEEFWTSFLWEKGLCYPDKYYFELKQFGGGKNGIFYLPKKGK